MLLAFYGRKRSLRIILSELRTNKLGTNLADLGTFFLENGFSVKIVVWTENLPRSLRDLDSRTLAAELHRGCEWKNLTTFLNGGGRISIRPVGFRELVSALAKKQPPILSIDVVRMYGMKGMKRSGHYVIPVAVNRNTMTINDPNFPGGAVSHPTPEIFHTCRMRGGGMLFIKPK